MLVFDGEKFTTIPRSYVCEIYNRLGRFARSSNTRINLYLVRLATLRAARRRFVKFSSRNTFAIVQRRFSVDRGARAINQRENFVTN